MSDAKRRETAVELAGTLRTAQGAFLQDAADIIYAALLAAETEAYERCAVECERLAILTLTSGDNAIGVITTARYLAVAIRALKAGYRG